MSNKINPTSEEKKMRDGDFIVSKTDASSRITYCNRRFIEMSGYQESELVGQPHNIIRHPDMPKAVYRLMWETIQNKDEFFGLVKNLCKDGAYYWTLANVTPSFDDNGKVIGYYSVRRKPSDKVIKMITPLYQSMCAEEARYSSNATQAMDASISILKEKCSQMGRSYNEAIYTSI